MHSAAHIQPLEALDSATLVTRARDGERAAFEELYRRYRPAVVRRLTHLLGPRVAVADLAQDAFAKAWQQLAKYRGDAPFSHWLLRITTNLARTHHRRLRRRPWQLWDRPEEQERARDTVADGASRYPQLEVVHLGLARLSDRLREAVVLFELEGLSLAELAASLDVPLNTAASRVRRGREKLRKELLRLGYDAPEHTPNPPAVELCPQPCRGESR